MTPVRIDRSFISRTLLFWLLLMWPLLVFNGPAYFEDTQSYFKGGAVAVETVMDRLMPTPTPTPPTPPPQTQRSATDNSPAPSAPAARQDATADLVSEAKGVRSITYSLFSYILAGPGNQFVPLAIVQALLVAICLTAALGAANMNGPGRIVGSAAILGLATTAAPFACFAMPDIFAGLTILVLALLTSPSRRLAMPLLLLLIAIAIFAITSHPSHIPLAAAMLGMAVLIMIAKALRGDRAAFALLYRTAGILVVAVVIVVMTGVIGFGEVSIAPKRYPFLLARAVEIPPARAYLQKACETQQLAVCEIFPDELPTTHLDFLWGDHGVDNMATPAQMEALRQEEPGIVLAMARTAPFGIATSLTTGVLRQLATFNLSEVNFRYAVKTRSPIEIALVADRPESSAAIQRSQWLTMGTVLLSLVAFGFWLRRRNPHVVLATMLIGGVVANAAVCSMLSTVANRYEARVIWLLPLAALLLWHGRRAPRR